MFAITEENLFIQDYHLRKKIIFRESTIEGIENAYEEEGDCCFKGKRELHIELLINFVFKAMLFGLKHLKMRGVLCGRVLVNFFIA